MRIFRILAAAAFWLPFLLAAEAGAADPPWWNDSAALTKIWQSSPQDSENWAPANVGQLKNVAAKAKIYLDSRLAGMGASGSAVTALVNGFTGTENWAPVNIGQLKNVAAVFYDRFYEVGYNWQTGTYGGSPSQKYPWSGTVNPENDAPANIGQLKNLFAFTLNDSFRDLMTDNDADSIPDFWEGRNAAGMLRTMGVTAAANQFLDANQLFADQENLSFANPFGQFTAGYTNDTGTVFTSFSAAQHVSNYYSIGVNGYTFNNWIPFVTINSTDAPITTGWEKPLQGRRIYMHPGTSGEKAAVRFTAPSTGTFYYSCTFEAINPSYADGVVVAVRNGSTVVKSALIGNTGSGSPASVSWEGSCNMTALTTLDFTVAAGTGAPYNYSYDSTALTLKVVNISQITATGDADVDGVSNLAEFRSGTDPAGDRDSDGDGVADSWTVHHSGNLLNGTLDQVIDGASDANASFAARETSMTGVPPFGMLIPGYSELETGFKPFTPAQYTPSGGFMNGNASLVGYSRDGAVGPCVLTNTSTDSLPLVVGFGNEGYLAPGEILLRPDNAGRAATVCFTAPSSDYYKINTGFRRIAGQGNTVVVSVSSSSRGIIYSSSMAADGWDVSRSDMWFLGKGETISYSAAPANPGASEIYDSIGLAFMVARGLVGDIPESDEFSEEYKQAGSLGLFAVGSNPDPGSFGIFGSEDEHVDGFPGAATGSTITGLAGYARFGSLGSNYADSSGPFVLVNRATVPVTLPGSGGVLAPGQMLLRPSSSDSAQVRFTAVADGTYAYSALFQRLNTTASTGGVQLYLSKVTFDASGTASITTITPAGSALGNVAPAQVKWQNTIVLAAGDSLVFAVGPGSGGTVTASDAIGLNLTCFQMPEQPAPSLTYEANRDFYIRENEVPSNPAGQFIAGYTSGTTFTSFSSPAMHTPAGGYGSTQYRLSGYSLTAGGRPCVLINRSVEDLSIPAMNVSRLAPGQLLLIPGAGKTAVTRFTAPTAGYYGWSARFERLATGGSGVRVSVLNGTSQATLQTAVLGAQGSPSSARLSDGAFLSPGQSLDFVVSGADSPFSATGLTLNVANLSTLSGPNDADGDGLTNLQEYQAGTDPWSKDTDSDGTSDAMEMAAGLDPLDPSDLAMDSDGDGIPNGVEAILRMEASRLEPPSSWAWLIPQLLQLDPWSSRDADADGVPDDYETVFGLPSAVPGAVYSANEAMAYRENGAPSNTFGPFKAGSGTGSAFTVFTQHTGANGFYDGGADIQGYVEATDSFPAVVVNKLSVPSKFNYAPLPLSGHQILMHPEDSGPEATLRFTAPVAGNYIFSAHFEALNPSADNGVEVFVRKGTASTLLFSKKIGHTQPQNSASAGGVCVLNADESLDFSVGANGYRANDSVGTTITCFQIPPLPAPSTQSAYAGNTSFNGNNEFVASEKGNRRNPFSSFSAGTGTGSGFALLPEHTAASGFYNGSNVHIQGHIASVADPFPAVAVNDDDAPAATNYTQSSFAPRQILLYPNNGGVKATLRFTAPTAGNYAFSAQFQAMNPTSSVGDGVEALVTKGTASTLLFSRKIGRTQPVPSAVAEGVCALAAGEALDFAVAPNASRDSDSTGLMVTCSLLSASPADVVYNGNTRFAETEAANPSNPFAPFEAGYNTGGSGYIPYTGANHTPAGGTSGFHGFSFNPSSNAYPLVYLNVSGTGIFNAPTVAAGQMVLHPNSTGGQAIVRFTAPVPGNYLFASSFQRLVTDAVPVSSHAVDVSVMRGASQTMLRTAALGVGKAFSQNVDLNGVCELTAGETLDFAVGAGTDTNANDATGLTLTVTRLADGPATDTDGDGLSNMLEAQARTWSAAPASWHYPSPAAAVCYSTTDENQDQVPDIFEPRFGFAVAGYTPEDGTDPASFIFPATVDTDADGAWDGQEVVSGSDPLDPGDTKFPPASGIVSGSGSGGGTSTGGSVDYGPFQAGYTSLPTFSVQNERFGFKDNLYFTGEGVINGGPPRRQLTPAQRYISVWPNPDPGAVEPKSWSDWKPIYDSDWGSGSGAKNWRSGTIPIPAATLGGSKVRLVGGEVPSKIILDEIVLSDSYYELNTWPSSKRRFKTSYSSRSVVRQGMSPYFKDPGYPFQGSYNAVSGTGSRSGLSIVEAGVTAGEFFFGGSDDTSQYYDQKYGRTMEPEGPEGIRGAKCEMAFPAFLFDEVSFQFPDSLTATSGLKTLEPNVFYDVWEVTGSVTFTSRDYVPGRKYEVGIKGRKIGTENVTYDISTPFAPYRGMANKITKTGYVIQGPVVILVQGQASTEPGDSYSLKLSEDGGSRFRKISLEGLPLADGKPQTEEETDSQDDTTYVDALNLTLAHHTSDLHIPVASSDLAISADRTLRQESWLNKKGQLPPSAGPEAVTTDEDGYIGKPFGVCWNSSLTPHIIFEVDPTSKDPSIATVVDETGAEFRFAYLKKAAPEGHSNVPTEGFIPLPSPSDQTCLLNRLDVITGAGSSVSALDLRKRFGTVTHYQLAGKNTSGNRIRYYFRIRNDNGSSTLSGVDDRYGNSLYYTYLTSPTGEASPSDIAKLLIPDSITDGRGTAKRRLVITKMAAGAPLNVGESGRFISAIELWIGNSTTAAQRTEYQYETKEWSSLAALPPISLTPNTDTRFYPATSRILLLKEVRRQYDGSGAGAVFIPQKFEYSFAYDQETEDVNQYHAHLWLSKMEDAAGRYHRFETVFDRTRMYYYGSNGSRKIRHEQGLDRPVSAVFFGTAGGQEQLLSEFKLQQGPFGEQAGFKVSNAFVPVNASNRAIFENPPVVTGNRINAVVDADRRIRYYKFTEPEVRDTKAFQDCFFPSQVSASDNPALKRSVLISWKRMEIDHTGGAAEVYTFDPAAMMALTSSEMTADGVTTRTEWKYGSKFKASDACAFLQFRTYGSGISIDDHPFFAKYYPDPTREERALTAPEGGTAISVPAPNSPTTRIIKTFEYWADGTTNPDNSKPWSRTMVRSVAGYGPAGTTSIQGATITKITLNATGLPGTEEITGPGSSTPDKTTYSTYGSQAGAPAGTSPSFLGKTEIVDGVAGGQSLITKYTPDQYSQVLKTVTGNDTTGILTSRTTQRNALGQMEKQYDGDADPATGATVFAYRMDGRLLSVTYPQPLISPAGTRTDFPLSTAPDTKIYAYDNAGRKKWEKLPDGTGPVFNYDARGRVVRTFQCLTSLPSNTALDSPPPGPGDPVTSSTYSAAGLLLTQTAPSGLTTSWQYDWLRRPVRQDVRDTVSGQTTTTLLGYEGGYSGDSLFSGSSFKPTSTQGPACYPGTTTLALTETTYDSLFRKVRETRHYAAGAADIATTQWAYDAMGRVIVVIDPLSRNTTSQYDALGNLKLVIRPDSGTTATEYTKADLPVKVTVKVPAILGLPQSTRVTTTAYDAAGRAWQVRLPSVTTPGVPDPDPSQEFLYDTAGRRTVVKTRQSDTVTNLTTTTVYDNRGRVASVRGESVADYGADPISATLPTANPLTEYKYDRMNRQVWTRTEQGATPLPVSSGYPEAALTVYDTAGRAIRTVSPVIQTANTTDGAPQAASRIMTSTAYDAAGRVVAVKAGELLSTSINTDTSAWSYAASTAYSRTGLGDPANGETFNTYDQSGRLLSTRRKSDTSAAVFVQENFAYDNVGNRTLVTDGEGKKTAFTYDAFGRLLTTIHNAGSTVVSEQDRVSNSYNSVVLLSTTDGNGKTTSFTYDSLYQLRSVTPSIPTTDPVENHYFNGAGEKLRVNYTGASWRDSTWTWDDRGRCLTEISSGLTHSYAYDNAGNRISAVYALGFGTPPAHVRKLTSSYDRLNRLSSCVETYDSEDPLTVGRRTSYFYNLNGGIRRKLLPNNTREEKTYDVAGRTITQATYSASGTIAQSSLSYDSLGNLVRQVESWPASGDLPATARTVLNTYDGISRLTNERIYPNNPINTGIYNNTAWKYDKAGNRFQQIKSSTVAGAPPTTTEDCDYTLASLPANTPSAEFEPDFTNSEVSVYRPNQLRVITRTVASPLTVTKVYFRYDGNGNRTRKWDTADATPKTTYTWDRHNRLTKVVRGTGTQQWDYNYDARSRRIQRTGPDNIMELDSFSGGTSVSRWNVAGADPVSGTRTLAVEYIRGSDFGGGVGGVLYTIDNSTATDARRFYQYGARGDVTGLNDAGGGGVFRSLYSAFGSHTDAGTPGPGRQRASTKEEESALGLLNEGFRYRDILTGTFLSRDPAGFVDGPNLYAYVNQNPWSSFDPEGLEKYPWYKGGWVRGDLFDAGYNVVTKHVWNDPGTVVAGTLSGVARGAVDLGTMAGSTQFGGLLKEPVRRLGEFYKSTISQATTYITGVDGNSDAFRDSQTVGEVLTPIPGGVAAKPAAKLALKLESKLAATGEKVLVKAETEVVEQSSKVVTEVAEQTAAKKPNLNSNDATSNFGLYEIETPVGLEKVGKADLNRITKSSGLPTRLHQQVRKLEKVYGEGNVKGTVVEDLGETTTAAAKAAENARIKRIVDETGQVPPGNAKSYKE